MELRPSGLRCPPSALSRLRTGKALGRRSPLAIHRAGKRSRSTPAAPGLHQGSRPPRMERALEPRRDPRPHRREVQRFSSRRGCPRHYAESDPIIYAAIKAYAAIKIRAGCDCMTTEELREQILQLVTEYTKQRH